MRMTPEIRQFLNDLEIDVPDDVALKILERHTEDLRHVTTIRKAYLKGEYANATGKDTRDA